MKAASVSKRQSGRRGLKPASDGRRRRALSARSYTATEAKNEFGRLLDQVLQGATVVITRHDAPKAVLISLDNFHALQQAPQLKLDALSSEFDAMLSRMQSAKARTAMERAFQASPERLGKAALAAVRRRG